MFEPKRPASRGALTDGLNSLVLTNEKARVALLQALSELSRECYGVFTQKFMDSLSNGHRLLYTRLCRIPYAPKDWWRDQHDIIVTRAITKIISQEAQQGRDSLPEWLVTAALIHDRGYGVLAHSSQPITQGYLKATGAHWENTEIRIHHSYSSRELAEVCLIGRDPDKLTSEPYAQVGRCEHVIPDSDVELFLEIVEKHDHPLIERYEDLPRLGYHHFDADSLYSISLSSFLKDYLSYLADERKLGEIRQSGVFAGDSFALRDLLVMRLSRYYASENELPPGWHSELLPLNMIAYQLTEGRRCIVPHSATAKQLTDRAFLLLRDCVGVFEHARDLDAFVTWMRGALFDEMRGYLNTP